MHKNDFMVIEKHRATRRMRIRSILIASYIVVLFYITLFGREKQEMRIFEPLFWEWQYRMWKDILMNIALFIPLGILFGNRRGIIIGFLLSVGIEAAQYLFMIGYCEVDDVANNTIGTVIGVMVAWIWKRNRSEIKRDR